MDHERFSTKKFIFLTVETHEVVKVGCNNMDFQLSIECSLALETTLALAGLR